MTTSDSVERQVAVLIDFENVGLRSMQWLFDQVSDLGRIIVRRAYADWSEERGKRDQLLQLGIEPIHLFHSASGKNSSDIRLAVDAVELLYVSKVDTFVIASSDSDFVPLVGKLRAAGRAVIGAGRREAASHTLVRSCDRYFFLDQDDAPATPRPAGPTTTQADGLMERAVKACMDGQGRALGSRLHETIQRLDPSFDFRAHGHSTFTRYLEAQPEVRVHRPGGQGDVTIELAEQPSPDARGPRVHRPGGQGDATIEPAEQPSPDAWGPRVDTAWSIRVQKPGQTISGSTAARNAARALGVEKLRDTPYKTLQKLLDASEYLGQRWSRSGDKIVRR